MKLLKIVNGKNLILAASMLLLSTNLFAAKAQVTGTIVLVTDLSEGMTVTVDGAFASAFTEGYPHIGDDISHNVSIDGNLKGGALLFVSTTCYQSGNGVFHQSNTTDYVITLDNERARWNTSESAECTSELIYQEYKGKKRINHYLAEAAFTVSP